MNGSPSADTVSRNWGRFAPYQETMESKLRSASIRLAGGSVTPSRSRPVDGMARTWRANHTKGTLGGGVQTSKQFAARTLNSRQRENQVPNSSGPYDKPAHFLVT